MRYGEIVAELLRRSGKLAKEYAPILNVTPEYLSHVVNNKEPGSPKLLKAALAHAKIPMEQCLTVPPFSEDDELERRLLETYRQLNDEGRQKLVDFVEFSFGDGKRKPTVLKRNR